MVGTITPETHLEQKILENQKVQDSFEYKSQGNNHFGRPVGKHVQDILRFIDRQNWDDYRERLRVVALLHDFGKHLAKYSENGHLIGPGHSVLSHDFAKTVISDKGVLGVIRNHDKYIHFYRSVAKGKFKDEKFEKVYSGLELPLLTRFNYADSNDRSKDSINWFEDVCSEKGWSDEKLYLSNPNLRD